MAYDAEKKAEDFVIATGKQYSVRQFIDLVAKGTKYEKFIGKQIKINILCL